MLALIDADLLVFRVGFTTQDEVEGIALSRLEASIDNIKETLNTDKYQCILSPTDKSNYRYNIDPNYKANRLAAKPYHYQALRNHLLEAHNASVAHGEEADDLLGITQSSQASEDDSIIVSIDKDLNQIPGNHFNFVKGDIYYVSPIQGLRWFYKQLLTGDYIDNVKGITGIGPVKSSRLLDDVDTESELYNIVAELYHSQFKDGASANLLRNGRLLWIRRIVNELWTPPETQGVTD